MIKKAQKSERGQEIMESKPAAKSDEKLPGREVIVLKVYRETRDLLGCNRTTQALRPQNRSVQRCCIA